MEDDIQNYLPTIMFRGTPGTLFLFNNLKGSERKMKEGIGLLRKISAFVASIRRKLLKTTHTEERSVYTNSKSFKIQLRIVKKLI